MNRIPERWAVALLLLWCLPYPAAPLPARVAAGNRVVRGLRPPNAPPPAEGGPEYATAPPLAWVLRALRPFPPREVVRSWCRFQRARGEHLEQLLAMRPRDQVLGDALDRHWDLYSAWHLLEEAQDPAGGPGYRASCLTDLRRRVGGLAFSIGRMPDPVERRDFDRAD